MKHQTSSSVVGNATHSKASPGPWKASLAVQNNGPNYYAVTNGKWGAPSIAIVDKEANARLIAAAPELLKEHREWAKLFGRVLVDALQGDFSEVTTLARQLSIDFVDGEPVLKSSVIAKATGDQD